MTNSQNQRATSISSSKKSSQGIAILEEIKKQTRDLLSYYPGRGKVPLLWLFVIPILSFPMFTVVFGKVAPITSDGLPAHMFYMAGHSFNWIYKLSLVIMLLRICHSERKRWRESVEIIGSSLSYSLLVGLPILLIAFVWIVFHVGTSAIALLQVLAALLCAIGALLLLLICLGSLARRFGIIIPFLIFLTTNYSYLLPVLYPASAISSHWQFIHTFAVPLAPNITLLQRGMLNQGFASGSFWMASLLHAIAGYGLALWIWQRNTQPGDSE